MQIARYQDIIPKISPWLPKCDTPFILQQLREAGRVFCERSEAWQHDIVPIDLVAEQTDYAIVPSWDARINRILEVRINTEDGVDAGTEGALQDEDSYDFIPPSTLSFTAESTYSVTDGLDVKVVLIPEPDSDDIDESFLDRWEWGIRALALSKMLLMKQRPWSDPDNALDFKQQYLTALNKAKAEVGRKYKKASPGFRAAG